MYLNELQDQRITVLKAVDEIRAEWKGKESTMPGDVEERLDKALADFDAIEAKIQREEKATKAEGIARKANDFLRIAGVSDKQPQAEAHRKAFNAYLRGDDKQGVKLAAYQADVLSGGGFFVTPMEWSGEMLTLLKDFVFIRGLAKTFTLTSADTLGVPAIDTDPSDTDWTTELRTGNEETTLAAGRRELKTNPMAKLLKLSKVLIRKAPNFEEVVLDRLVYKVGITEEKAFLTGDGSQKPLGIFTASTQGISTGRDVTAASSTVIAADDLLNTQYSLKAPYRAKAKWVLHRDVLKACRKLKDSNNNYIWGTGINPGTGFAGQPPTLLGSEYCESEYAPNTFTTGLYMAVYGNFDFYWIADALDMQIQVLDQLYAATDQMGYILRKETDGMPVLEEAFARLKLA